MNSIQKKRFESAVWGFVIGDALGVPYEMFTRGEMTKNPATGMIGNKTHNQPAGTWSDDTSMLLCTMDTLSYEKYNNINDWISKGEEQQQQFATRLLSWYKNGEWTANGTTFDIGITTMEALDLFALGTPANKSGITNRSTASGNAPLTRCLPIAFLFAGESVAFRFLMVSRLGCVTHKTEITGLCSLYYTEFLQALILGYSKLDAFDKAIAALSTVLQQMDIESRITNMCYLLKLIDKKFINLPENEIQSTGLVSDTLEASIWCFLNTNNYRDAVLLAVNLGDDTDSIAALTGALAGCYYYKEAFPNKWKNSIQNKSLIENSITAFLNKQ